MRKKCRLVSGRSRERRRDRSVRGKETDDVAGHEAKNSRIGNQKHIAAAT